ncbi:MAG: hypothetical protein GY841_00955 [FCB group bacterium]|nr:hypothetical protein [FCB group bacterium]
MTKKEILWDLTNRLLELEIPDLESIQAAVLRLEPEGQEAWKKYCDLKSQIRWSKDPDRKEKLVAEALQLGRKYGF